MSPLSHQYTHWRQLPRRGSQALPLPLGEVPEFANSGGEGKTAVILKGEFTVKLETIKAALQARVVSLNLNLQEAVAPIIVADKPAAPKPVKPVADKKPLPKKPDARAYCQTSRQSAHSYGGRQNSCGETCAESEKNSG